MNYVAPFIAEFVTTFIFTSVILFTGQPIAIGITLIALILFASEFSKGSLNPAVTIGLMFRGDLDSKQTLLYIGAEVTGAICAAVLYNYWKQRT